MHQRGVVRCLVRPARLGVEHGGGHPGACSGYMEIKHRGGGVLGMQQVATVDRVDDCTRVLERHTVSHTIPGVWGGVGQA